MKKKIWKRIVWSLAGLLVAAMIVVAFLPSPVMVETARAERGRMQVAVETEGKTRVRDRYIIAAPVTGRLSRIDLAEGSRVTAGTPIARIYPPQLDAMGREELERRIDAGEALFHQASVAVEETSARLRQAGRERDRMREVAVSGSVARQDLERADDAVTTLERELESARLRAQGAASELAIARAGRMALGGGHAVTVRSPASGRVLQLLEKSERVVPAGAPIAQIGDPNGLEIVLDVLSTDAVKIPPGGAIEIDGWGGDRSLRATVVEVEPAAFTKVSALGVEEQRVNVVARLGEPVATLGDGYRVDARIILWEGRDVLKVPTSALFRDGEEWSLFTVEDGVARRRHVKIGRMSSFDAEVISGVAAGSTVIVHPSDQVSDGVKVEARR